MDRQAQELVGSCSLFGGSFTACTSAFGFQLSNESNIMLLFSALGAGVAIFGFVYTVWNGNRNYKLALKQFELAQIANKERNHGKD